MLWLCLFEGLDAMIIGYIKYQFRINPMRAFWGHPAKLSLTGHTRHRLKFATVYKNLQF